MSDLEFVQDENENQENNTEPKVRQRVPSEYIEVKLSSLGKLDAPPSLHVRDYSGEDVVALALAQDENFLKVLVDILNNVVYEGFDCSFLHENEIEEIMLNITGNFWTPVIHDFPYPYTQEEWDEVSEERKVRIEKGQEKLEIDISIADLNTIPISDEFKEPITVKNEQGETVSFKLPRVRDYFIAQEYLEDQYRTEFQKFSSLENIYKMDNEVEKEKKLAEVDSSLIREYKTFNEKRAVTYIKAKQAQLLVKHNSKKLDGIDEQIKEYPHISARFWKQYNHILENQLKFGVDHDIKMTSPITKKLVTRRCYFRPLDYVPTNELQDSREYTVLFG